MLNHTSSLSSTPNLKTTPTNFSHELIQSNEVNTNTPSSNSHSSSSTILPSYLKKDFQFSSEEDEDEKEDEFIHSAKDSAYENEIYNYGNRKKKKMKI